MKTVDKTPLKLAQIPTKNKIQIIDNYSPSFNYIVEDDKVYYSQKGRDHWVDISENTHARTNLLKFLNDNYSFRGYDDREKEIYDLIQKGQYDFNTYGEEIPQKKPSQETTQVKKPLPKRQVKSSKSNKSSKL